MAREKDNLDKTQLGILNQKSKDMNQELVQDKMEWYLMQRTQMQNTEISGSTLKYRQWKAPYGPQ